MSQKLFSWHAFLTRRLRILAWLSLCALLLSQVWDFWLAELFAHFVPYYVVVWFLLACLLKTRWRWFWGACVVSGCLWLSLPWQMAKPVEPPALRVLWYNVNLANAMAEQETAAILFAHPDVIAIAEMDLSDSGWQKLRQAYPYGCEYREDSPFSLVLWSKQPLRECRIHMIGQADTTFPLIEAQVEQKTIFALHPPPPITAAMASFRQNYLTQAADMIAGRANVLVVGDMNSSPFSPVYRQLMNTARIQAKTSYYLPTWLPLGLNIDHALSRDAVSVRALDWLASDHRALLIEW